MLKVFRFIQYLRTPGGLRIPRGATCYLSFEQIALIVYLSLKFRNSLHSADRGLINGILNKFLEFHQVWDIDPDNV